jgi:uncharacterized protein DUF4402
MQKTGFAQITLAGFLVLFCLVFAKFVPVAEAASAISSATISVLEEISIQEEAALNFGQILAPTTGSQIFTVPFDGSPPSPGPGDGVFQGGQLTGAVSFFGNDNAPFTISIVIGGCSGFTAPVTLTEILITPGPYTLDATLSTAINIGGTINVPSNASGSGFCTYTLNADY